MRKLYAHALQQHFFAQALQAQLRKRRLRGAVPYSQGVRQPSGNSHALLVAKRQRNRDVHESAVYAVQRADDPPSGALRRLVCNVTALA